MNDSLSTWVAGARPRTLPAAIAPILAGVAGAAALDAWDWPVALLCLVVALALQIGVNFANDYSDGVRGTDDDRVGPLRLVASGLASPRAVKAAAFASFGVGALAGLAVVALSGHWWLLVVGILCILAAWFYTGGRKPYGYLGLGELMVFVFFGLVATVGTTYVISDVAPPHAWAAGVAVGALASAILVANNIRDIPTDRASGKMTLPARLGDRNARLFYAALCAVAAAGIVVFAALTTWSALIALLSLLLLIDPLRRVLGGAQGRRLIPVIQATGFAEIGLGLGLLVGVWLG
ncbi:1,4-dihydroxy-2-naphthoate prenyltransferase [Tessaracoccus bendigoensis DSM 12906]|uniref:1,4-dihydroxy-2-naphthoate octaprenyltransferase n=1 Tax=Tessaracoccus bendigoensis DSM 12906 TaxID=1123357 RepID=A0A1M6DX91_9ACTN|nr:1,4-dihydroxy-2-naphthoate polyprenyltransferase [Tessaracoccus bendigoensis]SHI77822.1 1,4-dihydroxy-2-naphthoate prenyltransferase [Tessaracoccus bendigoensis DSM 12906]